MGLPPRDWGQMQLWFIYKAKTLLKNVVLGALGLTVTAETNNSGILYKELHTNEKQGRIETTVSVL